MKELIEAYFGDSVSVSSYHTEIDNDEVLYVARIYNGQGCADSIYYVTVTELLEFMWGRIANDNN